MRKLCWFALPCSGGIFLCVYFFPEAFFLPLGGLCLLFTFFSLFFRGKIRLRIALAASGLAFSFLWTGCYQLLIRAPARSLITDVPCDYILEATAYPKETSRGASLSATIRTIGCPAAKIQLYAGEEALSLHPGDRFTCRLRLSPSDSLRGEAVDFYEARGIYLIGYTQDSLVLLERASAVPLRYLPQYTARLLKDSLLRVFPADVSGFFVALTTGDKSALPPGMYSAFQRSGISHVIAVSGLHMGVIAGLLAFLLGKRSRLSVLLGISFMFFFAALAGNTPSALRAAFMSSLLLIAPLVGREPDKATTLSAALLLVLLPCPYTAASASLQLSFGAVAGIYLITQTLGSQWLEAIPKWDGPVSGLLRKALIFLAGSLSVTVGALLFTTPQAALCFHTVSLVGPFTNLLTLWAVSGAFLGGLASALLGLAFPPLGVALGWLTAWLGRWIIFVARSIAQLPFASISLLSGYLLLWFILAYGILLLWLAGRRYIRPAIPAAALLLSLGAALFTVLWPSYTGALTVTALDVGQGSSTLFYSKGHSVLVDCGGNSSDDPGDIAADYLQALGSSHLDALILTHYHTDHACGVPELLSRLDVSLLILPDVTPEEPLRREIIDLAKQSGCKVWLLSDDSHFSFGNADLSIYAPLGDGGANEEGLSLVCTVGDFDVLITGDMNDVVERRIVRYKSLPDIELLVVGHHGSPNSTSEEILLAATPETAVISSGYNSYGHPSPEALERLGAAGCDIYLTDQMGTVTFTVKGE